MGLWYDLSIMWKHKKFIRELHRINDSMWIITKQSRGIRSTILIIDEFRLVSKDVIDKILSPTEISRQCPYLKFKEYEHLREEPREIYLSSAYYKSSWMWDEIRLAVSKYYNKGIEEAIFFSTDYSVTLKHGIKTKKALQRARQQSDEYSWMME